MGRRLQHAQGPNALRVLSQRHGWMPHAATVLALVRVILTTVLVVSPLIGCMPSREEGVTRVPLSAHAIRRAEELGGKPRRGQRIYVVVGASASTEIDAQRALERAIPVFGDMQTYFCVQRADAFDGLAASLPYVVIEAYEDEGNAREGLQLAARGFSQPYVSAVVVLTDDPIPLYEEMTR